MEEYEEWYEKTKQELREFLKQIPEFDTEDEYFTYIYKNFIDKKEITETLYFEMRDDIKFEDRSEKRHEEIVKYLEERGVPVKAGDDIDELFYNKTGMTIEEYWEQEEEMAYYASLEKEDDFDEEITLEDIEDASSSVKLGEFNDATSEIKETAKDKNNETAKDENEDKNIDEQ